MEQAILVHLATTKKERIEAEVSMEEMEGLVKAAGAEVVKKIFQYRNEKNPKFLVGEGKVAEIIQQKDELQANLVVFDCNLSPIQQRSLEEEIRDKVIDRTQVILDIFAQRARSKEGKLQVELAQLNYLLPRLLGKGHTLSRLGGGIGTRGPGEKKLEEDRRRIQDKISKIKKDISRIQKRRAEQRRSRKKGLTPVVSLIGYTNAGKSTLFNTLSSEKMLSSPQLFATLDPVIRRVTLPDGLFFFLSDTVGFIKKLPVELISAFKATLEEIKEADCLCHVIDITSDHCESQVISVNNVLSELGVTDIPIIKVYNKIDLLPDESQIVQRNTDTRSDQVYISAKTGRGIQDLKRIFRRVLFKHMRHFSVRVPKSKTDIINSFPKWAVVLKRIDNKDFYDLEIMTDPKNMIEYASYIKRGEVY
ncbi:MAG: GTPase HflX [Candidatus Aminicenantes bacterium]|jgi:GTP-binding protein HflX